VAEGAVCSELDPSFGSLYASELSNVAAKKRSILVGPEASSKVGMRAGMVAEGIDGSCKMRLRACKDGTIKVAEGSDSDPSARSL
jgi:hypothetical protein